MSANNSTNRLMEKQFIAIYNPFHVASQKGTFIVIVYIHTHNCIIQSARDLLSCRNNLLP